MLWHTLSAPADFRLGQLLNARTEHTIQVEIPALPIVLVFAGYPFAATIAVAAALTPCSEAWRSFTQGLNPCNFLLWEGLCGTNVYPCY